jgi:hypothetical protein
VLLEDRVGQRGQSGFKKGGSAHYSFKVPILLLVVIPNNKKDAIHEFQPSLQFQFADPGYFSSIQKNLMFGSNEIV